MSALGLVLIVLVALTIYGYYTGRGRAFAVAGDHARNLHSRPGYHGAYVALWVAIPSALLVLLWLIVLPQIADFVLRASLPLDIENLPVGERELQISTMKAYATGNILANELSSQAIAAAERYGSILSIGMWIMVALVALITAGSLAVAKGRISTDMRARNNVEKTVDVMMKVASTIAIMTTIGIVLSLLFESLRFFAKVPFWEFLFSPHWAPQTAIRADQVGSSGAFGAIRPNRVSTSNECSATE